MLWFSLRIIWRSWEMMQLITLYTHDTENSKDMDDIGYSC